MQLVSSVGAFFIVLFVSDFALSILVNIVKIFRTSVDGKLPKVFGRSF